MYSTNIIINKLCTNILYIEPGLVWDDFQSMLVDEQFVACSVVVSIDVFDGRFWMWLDGQVDVELVVVT